MSSLYAVDTIEGLDDLTHIRFKRGKLKKSKRVAARLSVFVVIGASGMSLASCGGSQAGLNASCSSYLTMTAPQQLLLASEWAYPQRNGNTDALSNAVASTDRDQLVTYCGQPGHGGDTLADLNQTFGP